MFLTSLLLGLIVDTSIPIQPKTTNLNGGSSIDLVDRSLTLTGSPSPGYPDTRVRGLTRTSTGYTVTKQNILNGALPDLNWQIKGVADFDGNGVGDLILQNKTTGANSVWLMRRNSGVIMWDSTYVLPTTPVGWEMKGVADFDGDGKQNILWQDVTSGNTAVWAINYNAGNPAPTRFTLDSTKTKFLTTIPAGWKMGGWADMNQDGIRDVIWQAPATGQTAIWELTSSVTVGNAYFGANVGANSGWKIEGAADYNSDGLTDLVWRNDSSNDTVIWKMKRLSGQTVIDQAYLLTDKPADSNWQITAVTDTNGDSIPDFIWSNYTTNENAVWEFKITSGVPSVNQGFVTDTTNNANWRFDAIAKP